MKLSLRTCVLVCCLSVVLTGCSEDEPRPSPSASTPPSVAVSAPPGPDPTRLAEQLLPASILEGGKVAKLPGEGASLEEVCGGAQVEGDSQRRELIRQEITGGGLALRQSVIAHAPGRGEAALRELREVLRSCTEYPTEAGVVVLRVLAVRDPGVATLALSLSGAREEVLVLTHAGDVTHVLRIRGKDARAREALTQRAIAASAAKLRQGPRPGAPAPSTSASSPVTSPSPSKR